MKINKINISKTIDEAEKLLNDEKNISVALKGVIKVLLSLMKIMLGRLSLNSKIQVNHLQQIRIEISQNPKKRNLAGNPAVSPGMSANNSSL